MKIDLHVHTKKCKQGDSELRNVTVSLFRNKISEAGVDVVAITNHNHFDLEQYKEFKKEVSEFCDVWPGIEFDVKEKDSNKGHVIVVVNPKYAEHFSEIVDDLTKETDCDSFFISVTKLTSLFNGLEPIFIPHFLKAKSLGNQDLELLEANVYNKNRLIKEPTDITSIGVLNAYNQKCLLGSDVQDWNEYEKGTFSELKYPFSGYENFLKLLDKDSSYIIDLLQTKFVDEVEVYGNSDSKKYPFKVQIFRDINVIFGDKGSVSSRSCSVSC